MGPDRPAGSSSRGPKPDIDCYYNPDRPKTLSRFGRQNMAKTKPRNLKELIVAALWMAIKFYNF